ncbi:MAG: hypothetical protein ABH842_01560 [Candidatus Micrarchaeota archaeon]
MAGSIVARCPEALEKVRKHQKLTVPESISVLAEGFMRFQQRTTPSSMNGVSFLRVAGQAACLDEPLPRSEIKRLLEKIKPGGVFLIFGHGHIAKCGAVAAKQAALGLPEGEHLHEPEVVLKLLDSLPKDVRGLESPDAELVNARYQATRVFEDPELREIIDKKNLTVAYAVCSDITPFTYHLLNRTWNQDKIFERHPKLIALRLQMPKALGKVIDANREGLDSHYAHAAFLYDPLDMRTVLDPFTSALDVGGICCVDARVTPNVPDSPKYLFRIPPNQSFMVTMAINGGAQLSTENLGSLIYSYGHVAGINSLNQHGEPGSGHTVVLTSGSDLDRALAVRMALVQHEVVNQATSHGENISMAVFDGEKLRLWNPNHGIDMVIPYTPQINILSI